jgi:alpha-glucoside transport system permease protein
MSAVEAPPAGIKQTGPPPGGGKEPVGQKTHRWLASIPTWVLWGLVAIWTIPTLGLLINSFRPEEDQLRSGWWTIFTDPSFTLDHYQKAMFDPPGGFLDFSQAIINSFAIAIPATVLPILMAAAAAYAFAWMRFPGRNWIFISVVALLAVPLQMALVPLLQLYTGGASIGVFGVEIPLFPDLDINNKPIAVWLAHVGFGLPLAVFLLHNYISSLPPDIFEAATIDGANHFTIFWRLVLPLSVPALASFCIFQFLWVWNDYLVALIFLSQNREATPLTIQLVNLVTSRGQGTELLPAAAFITMVIPLIIFFALQRFFVRGMLAGSVKG